MADDKIRVEIAPDMSEFLNMGDEEQVAALRGAFSDDPGEGRAFMLRDRNGNRAYEVHNPIPFAPPIGFAPTPPIDELIRDRVRAEFQRLRDEDEIDSAEEADDFDVPDEEPISSVFEIVQMEDTAPRPPPESLSLSERAKMHVDFMELAERERLNRKRAREAHLAKQKQALEAAEQEARLYSSPENSGRPDEV